MFYNFARFFGQQSKLDNLLKIENLTIETIFNEDDILQELKGFNSEKFDNFLIEHPIEYKKMIKYIVEEINDDNIDKTCRTKYAFYSSEILGSENEKLINFLFEKPEDITQSEINNPIEDTETQFEGIMKENDEDRKKEEIRVSLLNNLLQLLENDALIVTQAGYFAKVVNSIINKRGVSFWEHLKQNQQILSNMFKHCYENHILDIFEKLISLDDNYEQKNYHLNERLALLRRLALILKGKEYSQMIVQNICELFEGQFRKAVNQYETQSQEFKQILFEFSQQFTPSFFMQIALSSQQAVTYNVINAQYEFLNKLSFENEHQDDDQDKENLKFSNIIQNYSTIIKDFSKALSQQNYLALSFKSTIGSLIIPLGECKLSLIQLINNLLKKSELQKYFTSDIFQILIDLVRDHPQNNQLHLLFEKIVMTILTSNDEELQKILLQGTILIKFIIEHNNKEARKNKFGYCGILTRLSNYLNQNQSQSKQLQLSLQQMNNIWDNYLNQLDSVNKNEQEWILGINPKQNTFQLIEEVSSPNIIMPEPLVQYAYIQSSGFRKCESFENDDEDNSANNQEDIQQESDEQNIQLIDDKSIQNQAESNQEINQEINKKEQDSTSILVEEIIFQSTEQNDIKLKENEDSKQLDDEILNDQQEKNNEDNEQVINNQEVNREDNFEIIQNINQKIEKELNQENEAELQQQE